MEEKKELNKKELVKKVARKIMANLAMALLMFAIGFAVATSMYAAGFRFNLPRITVEYQNERHDLILIDRNEINQTASNR